MAPACNFIKKQSVDFDRLPILQAEFKEVQVVFHKKYDVERFCNYYHVSFTVVKLFIYL